MDGYIAVVDAEGLLARRTGCLELVPIERPHPFRLSPSPRPRSQQRAGSASHAVDGEP